MALVGDQRRGKDEVFAWRRTNPVDETDDSPMIIAVGFGAFV